MLNSLVHTAIRMASLDLPRKDFYSEGTKHRNLNYVKALLKGNHAFSA